MAATQAEGGRDALRRLFLVAADVQRAEGVRLDGADPGWRALCREVERSGGMTEEEMRERLIGLVKLVTELEC